MATDSEPEPKKRKVGALSPADKVFIEDNSEIKSIVWIAEKLDRNTEPVENYIKKNGLITYGMSPEDIRRKELIGVLHTKSYWRNVERQLTEDELETFEMMWADLMMSFNEDVMFAEELQMNQLIMINILITRVMRDSKKHEQEMFSLQEQIDNMLAQDEGERDSVLLGHLEQELSMARSAAGSFTVTHMKLLGESKFLHKDLKTTRDQRLKLIEDSKETFTDLIKFLDDEGTRINQGQEMELRRIAKDKAYFQLAQYHEYADGVVDRPILNSETVMLDNDDGKL